MLEKVLIIGGAGYVGSIVWPALQDQHTCYHLDLKPVPGAAAASCTVGSVSDAVTVRRVVAGMDCIVWLAMGLNPDLGYPQGSTDLDAAFNVNVRDLYRVLRLAQEAGVRRCVYASSLSVYHQCHMRSTYPLDESQEPDGWEPYGLSKRLGEVMGATWVAQYPQATFVGLRLFRPRNEVDWLNHAHRPGTAWHPIGPNDVRRLFLAAVAFDKAGYYVMQASGDINGVAFPNTRATQILGWKPQGN